MRFKRQKPKLHHEETIAKPKKRFGLGRVFVVLGIILTLGAVIFTVVRAVTASRVIAPSSTAAATQASNLKHIVRTSDGTLHTFVQMGTQTAVCNGSSKADLGWFYSTDNGLNWTCGEQLTTDASMYGSATVDAADNIYVVYSVEASGASANYKVYYRRLLKGAGSTWTLGAQQTAINATASQGYSYASIEAEGTAHLWLAARFYNGTNYQVSVYDSDAATDGAFSATPVWTLSQATLDVAGTSSSYHYPALVRFGTSMGVIYNSQLPTGSVRWRMRNDADDPTSWSGENVVSTTTPTTPSFTAIGDTAGNVYFAQNRSTNAYFNYWNGSVWSGTTTVSSTAVADSFISLSTDGANVWVFYGDTNNLSGSLAGSRKLVYKKGVLPFTAADFDVNPSPVVPYHDVFDKYWSYVGGAYTNDTTDAGSIAGSDVQMISGTSDYVYFGKTTKFDIVSWALSQNATGATLSWEYSTAGGWSALTASSSSNLNFQGNGYVAFGDPGDWATAQVNSEVTPYYYVRAHSTTTMSQAPIGLQMAAIPPVYWMNVLSSPVSGSILGTWTENSTAPTRVRAASVTVTAATPNTASTASLTPGTLGYSSTTASTYPATMRHLVRTSDGTQHAFIQAGSVAACGGSNNVNNAVGLVWVYSTDNGATWQCGGQLNNDYYSVPYYASATVDASDNIYVIYSGIYNGASASYKVYYRKLTKGDGSTWTIGNQQIAIDSNAAIGYGFAAVELDSSSRLWIAAKYYDGTNYQVSVYYSNNLSDAPVWTVSKLTLDTANTSTSYHFPAIVRFGNQMGIMYNSIYGNQRWRIRSDSDDPTFWVTESITTTETAMQGANWTIVSDGSNNVYYASVYSVYVYFAYWNGIAWSGVVSLSSSSLSYGPVGLSTDGANVWVFWQDSSGMATGLPGTQKLLYRKGVAPFSAANFDAAATALTTYQSNMDKYWSVVSGVYTNDTSDSGSTTAADTQMLTGVGDAVYFGKSTTFDSVDWQLSTNGVGGQVIWEYWNGAAWVQLTDFVGVSNDTFYGSGFVSFIPHSDWATTKVGGEAVAYYYVRARAVTAFSTPPVATQVTTVPLIGQTTVLANPVSNTVYGMWTENSVAPTRIRFGALSVTAATPNLATTTDIAPATAGYSATANLTAISTQRHIVRTSDGTLHSFLQGYLRATCGGSSNPNNAMGLNWVYSTDNGGTWNCGGQLSNDINNVMYASATVDASDNIYVVYSVINDGANSTYSTYFRKFTKGAGSTWTVGPAQNMLDASSGTVAYAYSTIEVQGTSRLWVATRYFDGVNYQVSTYYSSNMSTAPVWTASQTTLDTASQSPADHMPVIVRFGSNIGVIYNAQFPTATQRWRFRKDNDDLSSWSGETVVSTENMNAATFDAVGDAAGNVYYASNYGTSIYFSYWNGVVWTPTSTVDTTAVSGSFVSLSTDGASVWVFYGETAGLNGNLPGSRKLVYKKGIAPFSASEWDITPTPVVPYQTTFDKYWSYVSSAYSDKTAAAADTVAADTQMVTGVGDIAYFGKTTKFDSISWAMSTSGVSGIVLWEYWNGSTWMPMNDFLGTSNPSFNSHGYISFLPPSDWTATSVNGEGSSYYYMRARVVTPYTTTPVGLQMAAIPPIYYADVLAAPVSNTIPGIWTENSTAPVRARSSAVSVTTSTPNIADAANLAPAVISSVWYSSLTSATQPSTQRQLIRTSDGTLHAFLQAGNNGACGGSSGVNNTAGLDWLYSTDSGQNWTCGGQLSNDTAYLMYASATKDASDNIYVVYSGTASGANVNYDVYYRKLTKGAGATWTMEAPQTVLTGSATTGYSYSVMEADGSSRLWLATRYYDGANYQISTYYSDGLTAAPTWTVSQTTMETAANNASYHFPAMVRYGSKIGVIYDSQSPANMRWRWRADTDDPTTWAAEAQISTTNPTLPTYSAVGDALGNIYLSVNTSTNILFTAYTGSSWTTAVTVSSTAAQAYVSTSIVGTAAYVYYGDTTGLSGSLSGPRKFVYKKVVSPYNAGAVDVSATQVIPFHGTLDKYWSDVADTFSEKTSESVNTTAGDTPLFTAVGDAAYFGKTTKFDNLAWVLSVNGIGGQVMWEYWNGSAWVAINHFLGVTAPSFTANGYISFIPPTDWSMTSVSNEAPSTYYYLRARVVTTYSTPPVGTQIAAVPQINWVTTVASAPNLYYAWTENGSAPTRVRFSAYEFNVAPSIPTLLGPAALVNGSANASNQPALQFTTSDANVGDTVSYQIIVDDSQDFLSPVINYTSGLLTPGITTFTVGQAVGGGSYAAGAANQTLADGAYYWKVKVTDSSGLLSDFAIANLGEVAFSIDTTAPSTNASGIIMLRSAGGTQVDTNEWTNNLAPYFSWDAAVDAGSGVRGYCLSLWTDDSSDPQTSKGMLGTSPVSTDGTTCQFIVSTTSVDFTNPAYQGNSWLTTSNTPYYFTVRAIDNTGNIFSGPAAQFYFRFDNTPPTNVSYISPASGSFSNVVDMSFSWPTSGGSTSTDANSHVLGWQYRINTQVGPWLGVNSNTDLGISYIATTSGSYDLTQLQDGRAIVPGNNTIYFRTVDVAGNFSSEATIKAGSIQYGGAAPTFSGNDSVTVTPTTASANSYALSWPTAADAGSTINHYYYMVNTTPPTTLDTLQSNTSTYIDNGTGTSAAEGGLPNVNRGSNTVYVVAVDEADNYSPSNYITGSFTLNSTAPDNVGSLTSSDSSIKSDNKWMVTLSWTAPDYQGAGNLTYQVFRSSDGSTFSQVGTTTGLSYVDSTPDSVTYYYKVYTKDGANAISSGTNAVSVIPTGKWTEAPTIQTQPAATNITTKKATISWSTSRAADSKISYGTSAGSYGTVEPSSSSQVTAHSVQLTGLQPGTIYYYKAKWTDEDGNTGTSTEKTFTTADAPTVKDVSAKSIGLSSAVIQYTTNGSSKVRIYYGTTTSFGGILDVSTSTNESLYTSELTGLTDGTKYYYKINTFDAEAAEYEGTILDFTTLPRPKISGVRLQQVAGAAQTTMLVTWQTNTEVSSIITYYPEGRASDSRDEVNIALVKGTHHLVLTGLLPQTPYILTVKGRDKVGNEATSDTQRFTTATDTRPPMIAGVRVEGSTSPIAGNNNSQDQTAQFVVSWNTDEPATSQVEYGEGTGTSYAQRTQEDANLTINHIVIISSLTPSKVYHLHTLSKDKAGNLGSSVDTVAITPKSSDSALNLVISNLQQVFGFVGGIGK